MANLNKSFLIGRLTDDPKLSVTPAGKNVASFSVAVNRRNGEADFINCEAWEKTADFVSRYFRKSMAVFVEGEIRTGKYEKNGITIPTVKIRADRVDFVEKKQEAAKSVEPELEELEPGEELPF